MSDTDTESGATPRKVIYGKRVELQKVRDQYRAEQAHGQVSERTKRELVVAAAQLYDVLTEHSENGRVREIWEKSNVEDVFQLFDSTTTITVNGPGRGVSKTVQRPKIMDLDHQTIFAVSKLLDQICKELGFAAEAKTSREEFHIASPDDDHPEPVNDNVPKPGEQPK